MTCCFLDNLSLATLVAPTSVEEFRSQYWERKPLIIHRSNPDYYADLFTLEDFDQAIIRSPDYVKLANAETKKNASYKAARTEGLEAVLADMRAGGTLVLDQLHHREPKLNVLCRVLAAEVGHRFQTNLYLTPANGRGFSPHWDNHDVFILQVVGSKHWNIEKQIRKLPSPSEKMENDGERELRGEVDSFVLEQGDLIYIPRGFVHAAECGAEPSLHITLGVTGVFWEDLLGAAVRAAVLQDDQLRYALPLGFHQGPRNALVSRLRGMLRQLADDAFLSKVVDQYIDESVRTYPLDISSQVVEFFQGKPLTLDQRVGVRRGIAYQMHVEGDSVRVNYGSRAIVFAPIFCEAVEFALRHPVFAVRDVPGDLIDDERLAFVERMLEEGLVVRRNEPALPELAHHGQVSARRPATVG